MNKNVVRDGDFEELYEVRTDAKDRVTLSKALKYKARVYKVYQNSAGQIILDPQVSIPAHEAWLFKNKTALTLVKKGLEDAKAGKLVPWKDVSKRLKSKE